MVGRISRLVTILSLAVVAACASPKDGNRSRGENIQAVDTSDCDRIFDELLDLLDEEAEGITPQFEIDERREALSEEWDAKGCGGGYDGGGGGGIPDPVPDPDDFEPDPCDFDPNLCSGYDGEIV